MLERRSDYGQDVDRPREREAPQRTNDNHPQEIHSVVTDKMVSRSIEKSKRKNPGAMRDRETATKKICPGQENIQQSLRPTSPLQVTYEQKIHGDEQNFSGSPSVYSSRSNLSASKGLSTRHEADRVVSTITRLREDLENVVGIRCYHSSFHLAGHSLTGTFDDPIRRKKIRASRTRI